MQHVYFMIIINTCHVACIIYRKTCNTPSSQNSKSKIKNSRDLHEIVCRIRSSPSDRGVLLLLWCYLRISDHQRSQHQEPQCSTHIPHKLNSSDHQQSQHQEPQCSTHIPHKVNSSVRQSNTNTSYTEKYIRSFTEFIIMIKAMVS